MKDTFTQICIHIVFSVKNREALISDELREPLYKTICGIIQNYTHKVLSIGGTEDHIHILISMRPTQSVSDLVRIIKCNSSKWINENHLCRFKFEWQVGFGAFSYAKSQIPNVISYIEQQKEHHRKKSFIEEYNEILQKFGIDN